MRSNASEWETRPIRELIDDEILAINDGYRAKNAELGVDGLPFVRAGNVNNGFRFGDVDRLTWGYIDRVGNKRSRPGDVVFTSKGTVGRFAFVRDMTREFVYSPQLCFWRVLDSAVIAPRFLHYWMHGRECQHQFHAAKGSTDMADYISLRDQRQMSITLPPVGEQRRVAWVLGSLDDKIESNRRIAKALEDIAATLFKARFVDFVDHDDLVASEIGLIPRGWEVIPLFEAIDINPRVSTVKKGVVVPHIGMSDVQSWGVRPDQMEVRAYAGGARFEPGDTLMARITGCIEHGKGAFADFLDGPGAGSTEFLVLRAKPPLTPEMVFLLSRMPRVREHAIANMSGSSGRQRVQTSAFNHLMVAVPPNSEILAREAVLFKSIFQLTRLLWRESRVLAQVRDALLSRLISGQIRVPTTGEGEPPT